MKEIELTQDKKAIVDDDDYEYLNQFKWHVSFNKKTRKYSASRSLGDNSGKHISLPRFLLGVSGDVRVRHKNGNSLDCRRSNLYFGPFNRVHGGSKRCPHCKQVKPVSDFVIRMSPKGRSISACHDCELARSKANNPYYTYGWECTDLFSSLAKRCLRSARGRNLEFSVTKEDIERLWIEQDGRCAVTGIKFSLEKSDTYYKKNAYRPSIDRIDNSRGYTPDNIRIVLCAVNIAINDFGLDVYLELARAAVAKADAEPVTPPAPPAPLLVVSTLLESSHSAQSLHLASCGASS